MSLVPQMQDPGSTQSSRRSTLLWFVLAIGFIEGAIFNFLPVTFSVFERAFHVNLEQLGRLQLLSFAGATLFSVIGGWIIMRLGFRWSAGSILLALFAALVCIGSSPLFSAVLFGALLLGFGLVGIEVISNSMISEQVPEPRQHVFFIWAIVNAAGATVGPAALGLWLAHALTSGRSWRLGYFGVACIVLVVAGWRFTLRSPDISSAHNPSCAPRESAWPITVDILSHPPIYLVSLATFLHGLAQVGMISWIGQLYQERYAIGLDQAAYFISLNSAGFFIGRSILGWLTRRYKIPELVVLGVCALGGTLAFVATIASPSYWMGLTCFTLAGVFISGDGPSIYSYTGLRFAGRTAVAFALMNGLGNTGAAVGAYFIGLLGARVGLSVGIWLMPLFSFSLAFLAFGWFLREKRTGTVPRTPSIPARELV
jgi:fucose permease